MSRVSCCLAAIGMLAALLGLAGVAQAQVAAPRLNPTESVFGGPSNPATMMWRQGSRIGLSYASKVKVEVEPTGGPATPIAEGKGSNVSLAFVGPSFGLSASIASVKLDLDPVASPPGGTHEIKSSQIGLAAQAGKSISLGAGLESSEESDTPTGGTAKADKRSGPLVGGVWQLGDTFYIGGTYSPQKADLTGGGGSASGERKVSRVGAGFYWLKGPSGFHLEANYEKDGLLDVTDSVSTTSVLIEKGTRTGLTLEALFSNILIGVVSSKSKADIFDVGSTPQLDTVEQSARTISLGWVREKGLAIVVNVQRLEDKHQTGGFTTLVNGTSVGLSVLF